MRLPAAALALCLVFARSTSAAPLAPGGGKTAFETQVRAYVIEFLRKNPTVHTYLGGAGLDPALREVDGRLRDHSAAALKPEDRWLRDTFVMSCCARSKLAKAATETLRVGSPQGCAGLRSHNAPGKRGSAPAWCARVDRRR